MPPWMSLEWPICAAEWRKFLHTPICISLGLFFFVRHWAPNICTSWTTSSSTGSRTEFTGPWKNQIFCQSFRCDHFRKRVSFFQLFLSYSLYDVLTVGKFGSVWCISLFICNARFITKGLSILYPVSCPHPSTQTDSRYKKWQMISNLDAASKYSTLSAHSTSYGSLY